MPGSGTHPQIHGATLTLHTCEMGCWVHVGTPWDTGERYADGQLAHTKPQLASP